MLLILIEKSIYLSCYDQYPVLKDAFFDWKGENKQTDDVILVTIEM